MVLAPANFKDHVFVKEDIAELLENGLHICLKVKLTKRTTVTFIDPTKKKILRSEKI